MTHKHKTTSIGIDVAKAHLDAYCMTDQSAMRFTNDATGITKLIKWALNKGKQPLIVLEPSGGYERDLERAVQSRNDMLLAKVNAKYIRDFARAKGRLAKTDAIDAQIIAEYGLLMSPRVSIDISQEQRDLKDLVIRRRQVVKMHAEENNRLEKAKSSIAVESIQAIIAMFKQEIKALDTAIRTLIKSNDTLCQAYKMLQDMCGVGPITAYSLLADLPELGRIGNKSISSLIGVAPHNIDSGTMRGQRCIQGGRTHVRDALYLATLTATRYDGVIRDFYLSLIARGKKPKVALIACIRKMIIILNARMRDFYQIAG
jgi:transposase